MMSRHIEKASLDQIELLPARLDDYVPGDHIVRVIAAFVDRLNVAALGFAHAEPAQTGRPSYSPRDLLKLYIYGYVQGVQSSRRLETECGRNIEVMWLLGRLAPDFKTIASFRQRDGAALVAVCAAFVQFCRAQGQLVGRQVAIDGSKIRAVSSRKQVVTKKGLAKAQEETKKKIAEYLQWLDEIDAAERSEPGLAEKAAWARRALERLQQRESEMDELQKALQASGKQSLVTSEPEARSMRCDGINAGPAYNAQLAVSTDTHLIVTFELTNDANDRKQLHPMASAAQQALGLEPPCDQGKAEPTLQVLADAGYSSGEQAARCEADGIEVCAPPQRAVNQTGLFDISKFTYDPQTDTYTCPAGELLRFKQRVKADKLDKYVARDCRYCPLKEQCTKNRRRSVTRSWFEDPLRRMAERMAADPSLLRRRRCTAEHPFGTLKRKFGGRFLTKGLKSARTELALKVLAYNFSRLARLCGAPVLLAALA
jgi:transposase